MNAKRSSKALRDYNAKILAEHSKYRDQILALRPDWSRAELEKVTRTYGDVWDPGLHDVLETIKAADALAARFAKGGAS